MELLQSLSVPRCSLLCFWCIALRSFPAMVAGPFSFTTSHSAGLNIHNTHSACAKPTLLPRAPGAKLWPFLLAWVYNIYSTQPGCLWYPFHAFCTHMLGASSRILLGWYEFLQRMLVALHATLECLAPWLLPILAGICLLCTCNILVWMLCADMLVLGCGKGMQLAAVAGAANTAHCA